MADTEVEYTAWRRLGLDWKVSGVVHAPLFLRLLVSLLLRLPIRSLRSTLIHSLRDFLLLDLTLR